MVFTTKEVSNAVHIARKSIAVKYWTRKDMGDPVTDGSVQAFAGYVMSHYGKAILEALIADKAAEDTKVLVIAERKVAGL